MFENTAAVRSILGLMLFIADSTSLQIRYLLGAPLIPAQKLAFADGFLISIHRYWVITPC
jgi:hypothetical protein